MHDPHAGTTAKVGGCSLRKRRLPPLNTLRGFEASARHLSFTKAAEELFLTQGAISRQVKELEIDLNQKLFRRYTRRIELTNEGERFYQVVESVLDNLEHATARLDRKNTRKTLTISALPTIANAWLMPRLHLLANSHPDIEVQILSSIEPADLLAHEADIAIRVGKLPGRRYDKLQPRIDLSMVAKWDNVHADELFPDRLIPVCSPRLMAQPISSVSALSQQPLIHTTTRRNAWPDWFRAHNVKVAVKMDPKLQFGHFFMAIEAARQGRGVALVPDVLITEANAMRELTVPIAASVLSAGEYYLLIHESRLVDPHIQKFRAWVLSQALGLRRAGTATRVNA
jgi:LysR family transcriptional regulator, glycine cleavage system transcriptional activator